MKHARQVCEDDDVRLATILNSLGNLYIVLNDTSKSAEFLSECMQMMLQSNDTMTTSMVKDNIATLFACEKFSRQSEILYAESLYDKTRLLGCDHIEVARTLCCLARLYSATSSPEVALRYLQEGKFMNLIFSIYSEIFIDNCVHLNFLSLTNDTVTRIFRLNLHDGHDEIAYSLFMFGKVYAKQNDNEKALKYYFDSLFIYREKVGSDNMTVGEIIYNIGSIYDEMQQLDLAAKFFREAIFLYSRLSGMKNESGIQSQFQLGRILFELNHFDEAISSLKNVIKISTKHFKKEDSVSSYVIDSFLILGKIHSKLNNFHEAISCLKVGIVICI